MFLTSVPHQRSWRDTKGSPCPPVFVRSFVCHTCKNSVHFRTHRSGDWSQTSFPQINLHTVTTLNQYLHIFFTSFSDCCSLIATRFWVVVICPIIKCVTVLEFYFILYDLRLFITIFNFILNYVPIVQFWIFTYHKIWILLIIFCFIWSYWIIYSSTCLEVFWSVVS